METIKLTFDLDGSGKQFDAAVHHQLALKDDGMAEIVVKNNGTTSGKPIACITFGVILPDGAERRAQTVTTVRLLRSVLQLLAARYPEEINPNPVFYRIWSNEHGAWWLPGEAGYTRERHKAGHYTLDEALAHCNVTPSLMNDGRPPECIVPIYPEAAK